MKAIVQRVSKASVKVNDKITGEISNGIMVLLGITYNDDNKVIDWIVNKLINLRIFPDDEGKLNRSVIDIKGGVLLVSNFTLYGDTKKGFRPSFGYAATPDISEPIYNIVVEKLKESGLLIQTGIFGAMMDVELINDGPVTIIIEKDN